MSEPSRVEASLTVHLMGGLGNQLFQYAFGRRLAIANNARLYLDASAYPSAGEVDPARGLRRCELGEFRIAGQVLERTPTGSTARPSARRRWRKILAATTGLRERLKPYYERREIIEPAKNHFRFDHHLIERRIDGPVSARGYWQSEKYFEEIGPRLRAELTLKRPLDSESERIAAVLSSTLSAGIHVRHGDNANEVAAPLGVLPREYYARVCAALREELGDVSFFVFSDDSAWARNLLDGLIDASYVTHNGPARGFADLWLMSLCRHHVLANSTFSWWAAWIGRKAGQIVYAPSRYYLNLERPNPDLYPAGWRLIGI